MDETINSFILPALNSTQQFVVKLLCEYHEDKIAKIEYQSDRAISSAKNEKRKLKAQILTQKLQISQLWKRNTNLELKLRSAENTIRILTKKTENHCSDKNSRILNIPDFEHLFQEKLNEKSNKGDKNTKKILTNTQIQEKSKKGPTTTINKKVESRPTMKRKPLQPLDLKAKGTNDLKTTLKQIQQKQNKKNNDLSTPFLNNNIKKDPIAPKVKKPYMLKKAVKTTKQEENKENKPPFKTVVKPTSLFKTTYSDDFTKNGQEKDVKRVNITKTVRFKFIDKVLHDETYIVNGYNHTD